jgi:hypothetical protein
MERNNELNGPGGPEEGVAQGAPIGWESSERVAKFYVSLNVQF